VWLKITKIHRRKSDKDKSGPPPALMWHYGVCSWW